MSDYTPFKMNGFSGFGNSPVKQKETYGGKNKKEVKKELSKHRKNIDKSTTSKKKAEHSKKYYSTMF
jgi:hypothetical protein